jgi:Tfp pilus assembly protein PilV
MNQRPVVLQARAGFSLVELVFAMLLGSVALLALGGVLASTARVQAVSASKLELMTVAESKMDELRFFAASRNADTLKVAVGGSLTSSVGNYYDAVTSSRGRNYFRRWQIASALNGTRTVSVRVLPTNRARIEPAWYDINSLLLVE